MLSETIDGIFNEIDMQQQQDQIQRFAFVYLFVALSFVAPMHVRAQSTTSTQTQSQDQGGPIKQSRSSMIGIWKIVHPDEIIDSTHIPYTLLFLKADSTFIWGVDSSKTDPMANTLRGRWKQTAFGELKLMIGPDLSTGIVGYYQRLNDTQYRLFNKVDDSTKDELVQTNDTTLDKVGEIREEQPKE